MKLLTFKEQGAEYLGAFTDTGVVNLSAAVPEDLAFSSMQQFIEAGQPALDRAYALLASGPASTPPDQVDWLAPLPLPAQIRDCLGFDLPTLFCLHFRRELSGILFFVSLRLVF